MPLRNASICRASSFLALSLVAATACRSPDSSTDPGQSDDAADGNGSAPIVYDDCVLSSGNGTVPEQLHTRGSVSTTSDWGRFTKSLEVYGITLVAKDDVSDAFLEAVATSIVELFPQTVPSPEEQAEILRNLYRYRAVIPVFAGGERGIDEAAIESIQGTASVCDIIMLDVPERQAMEVIEHVLHIVSDVGLHHAYPERWGMTSGSELFASRNAARDEGAYDTSSYGDIDEAPIRERVELQEYAYWVITTYWDLQSGYGPNEREWTARTPAQLEQRVPSAYSLVEATVGRTMAAPSTATMDTLDAW
ncbi:MAG: hypothetical protein AAF799_24970 [Myxococcota bacterium]